MVKRDPKSRANSLTMLKSHLPGQNKRGTNPLEKNVKNGNRGYTTSLSSFASSDRRDAEGTSRFKTSSSCSPNRSLRSAQSGEDTGKSVDVALVIAGNAAGTPFEGTDTIRLLLKG